MGIIFDPSVEYRIMVCVTPQKSCERLIKRGGGKGKRARRGILRSIRK
jgi:two-component system sensor histidine kinase KdpD